MIFNIFIAVSFVTAALIVWFKTEAFEEYATLVGGDKFFKVRAFRKSRERDAMMTYHSYLLSEHDSFFIRLITCPYCLSFWLCLGMAGLQHRLDLLGIYYVGSLLTYGLVSKVTEE